MIEIRRKTKETRILLRMSPESGPVRVETGDGFLNHMVEVLAFYAGMGLELEATGDLRHHLIEDVAIALGRGIAEIRPTACARYGEATIPMDDALVQSCVDLGDRPYYEGNVPKEIYDHFLRSLTFEMRATVHVRVLRGRNRHHIVEAAMKALGRALAEAMREDRHLFSTKGKVEWQVQRLDGKEVPA